MMNAQYGSFEIQSPVMINVLNALKANADKKYFVVVGDTGTGKTTMMSYINREIFGNQQTNLFDEVKMESVPASAIVTTSREAAFDVIKQFDRKLTHIVEMPALSERKLDIPNFAAFFIEVLALMNNKSSYKLTEKAVEKLLQYTWPGNFHELESVLESAFHQSQEKSKGVLEPEHIELDVNVRNMEFTVGQKLDEVERKYILQTLYFVHQNRTKAAEILGISIRTLRNKINLYREEGYL